MSFLNKIGKALAHAWHSLFNAAKAAYEKLSPEEQQALQNGSGLLAIINQATVNTGAEIREAIQKRFPNMDAATLEDAAFKLAKTFNITSANNVDEALEQIKAYLSSLSGKAWAEASHIGSVAISILFAPNNTKVGIIVSLIEWVYQTFFHKEK